mmetsp:Transcript_39516/g.99616  ORF Transcript_39516/g.99616 Transcript_39516/m.99616 type:complete len:226 (-) Transcript_39516:349-1026(-)
MLVQSQAVHHYAMRVKPALHQTPQLQHGAARGDDRRQLHAKVHHDDLHLAGHQRFSGRFVGFSRPAWPARNNACGVRRLAVVLWLRPLVALIRLGRATQPHRVLRAVLAKQLADLARHAHPVLARYQAKVEEIEPRQLSKPFSTHGAEHVGYVLFALGTQPSHHVTRLPGQGVLLGPEVILQTAEHLEVVGILHAQLLEVCFLQRKEGFLAHIFKSSHVKVKTNS